MIDHQDPGLDRQLRLALGRCTPPDLPLDFHRRLLHRLRQEDARDRQRRRLDLAALLYLALLSGLVLAVPALIAATTPISARLALILTATAAASLLVPWWVLDRLRRLA